VGSSDNEIMPRTREPYGAVNRGLCALAVIATAGCGGGASSWDVRPDGRIGPLKIDVSTESDVRDFAGKPFKIEKVFSEAKKDPVGYELYYRCGRRCVTTYAIAYSTRRLSDFHTQSARFVSERGSHVGMSATRAARPSAGRSWEPAARGMPSICAGTSITSSSWACLPAGCL
jgi:hypothetical protein